MASNVFIQVVFHYHNCTWIGREAVSLSTLGSINITWLATVFQVERQSISWHFGENKEITCENQPCVSDNETKIKHSQAKYDDWWTIEKYPFNNRLVEGVLHLSGKRIDSVHDFYVCQICYANPLGKSQHRK